MDKKSKIFIGMDPSFTSFGIVCLDSDGNIEREEVLKTDSKKSVVSRLLDLENKISDILEKYQDVVVYLEGPSYYSSGKFSLQMGALHYMLRMFFVKKKIEHYVISPSTLKKYVTGKGNCKKDLIILNVYKKWGVEFSDHNLADAYGLARMALEEQGG